MALDGAVALAAGFDRRLGVIPVGTAFGAGPEPRAGVDALGATVALLGFAADAGRHDLEELARAHAGRHLELLVGADGRVRPEVALRADGAAATEATPPQVWARGQAWGVLGSAAAARRWGGEFTDAACRTARWWLDQVGTGVPPAVLGRPDVPVDTSAAAVVAAGLLDLSEATGDGSWVTAARRS